MGKVFLVAIFIIAVTIGILAVSSKPNDSSQTPPSTTLTPPAQAGGLTAPTGPQQQAQQQAQTAQDNQPIGPQAATLSATIKTTKGTIELTLFRADAPNTVANFINKAKSGFYKNLIFHRVEDWVIQGGDPLGNGTGGGQMLTELNDHSFVTGSLGVARGQDIRISNDAQFFITKSDSTWLDKQYTNFGIVTSGMDVVNSIKIGDKILGITVEE